MKSGRLGIVQFILTEKCNLNCNLCTHFCPLVLKERNYEIDELIEDAFKLKTLTRHIDIIGLWGGESLLYTDQGKAILTIHELFPDTMLELGTNGLLIPKISVDTLRIIKKTNTCVVVSGYPPTMKQWDNIKEILEIFNINYRLIPIGSFFKRYEKNGQNEIEETHAKCFSKICHTIFKGEVSGCYFPIAAYNYNQWSGSKVFDREKSYYNLSEIKSIEEFSAICKKSMDMCKYCGNIQHEPWRICNVKNTTEKDWLID